MRSRKSPSRSPTGCAVGTCPHPHPCSAVCPCCCSIHLAPHHQLTCQMQRHSTISCTPLQAVQSAFIGQVVEDSAGNVKIVSSNAGKDFAAEEISAQVLRKLVDDAGKFLNDKVTHFWPSSSLSNPILPLSKVLRSAESISHLHQGKRRVRGFRMHHCNAGLLVEKMVCILD